MSAIDQVIAAAKAIALSGHTPTVALIKSRVGKTPMPMIVQGLQQFKAIPKNEWQNIKDVAPEELGSQEATDPMIELTKQFKLMQQQIDALNQRVAQLETQLKLNEIKAIGE